MDILHLYGNGARHVVDRSSGIYIFETLRIGPSKRLADLDVLALPIIGAVSCTLRHRVVLSSTDSQRVGLPTASWLSRLRIVEGLFGGMIGY